MRAYPRLKRRGFTARNYIAHFWNTKVKDFRFRNKQTYFLNRKFRSKVLRIARQFWDASEVVSSLCERGFRPCEIFL